MIFFWGNVIPDGHAQDVEKKGHLCGTMHRLGNGFYFCERDTQTCEWYLRVVPGNPEKL